MSWFQANDQGKAFLVDWAQDEFMTEPGKYKFDWDRIKEHGLEIGLDEAEVEDALDTLEKITGMKRGVTKMGWFKKAREYDGIRLLKPLTLGDGKQYPAGEAFETMIEEMSGEEEMSDVEDSDGNRWRFEDFMQGKVAGQDYEHIKWGEGNVIQKVDVKGAVGPEGIKAGDMLRVTKAFADVAIDDIIEVTQLSGSSSQFDRYRMNPGVDDLDLYVIKVNGKEYRGAVSANLLLAHTTHINRTESEGGQPSMLDRARDPIKNTTGEKIEPVASWFDANLPPLDPSIVQAHVAGTLKVDTIVQMAIQASTGYTDTLGTARAATLMGMASAALWKKAVAQAKKEVAKEAHEKIEHLSKWGTVKPSEAACRDIVQKLLAEKGCYPFPELVAGVLAGIGTKQEPAGE